MLCENNSQEEKILPKRVVFNSQKGTYIVKGGENMTDDAIVEMLFYVSQKIKNYPSVASMVVITQPN
jgi:hypothetical protein